MPLKNGRFDRLSRGDATALLRELEGPLLEITLAQESSDAAAGDVMGEVMRALHANPRVQAIFPTEGEWADWDRFKLECGDGPEKIGEFIYGERANPWAGL